MPEGKQFIKDFLLSKRIKTVLDVGPGSGNYYDLLTQSGEYRQYPGGFLDAATIKWIAVEIWEPYITIFDLRDKYDEIIISDIYDLDWEQLGPVDVVILGDVLEHMIESKGREVIKAAVNHSNWVILSLPIIDYPQEASWGNKYEAHVEQYSPERIKTLLYPYEIVAYQEGEVMGSYIIRGKP